MLRDFRVEKVVTQRKRDIKHTPHPSDRAEDRTLQGQQVQSLYTAQCQLVNHDQIAVIPDASSKIVMAQSDSNIGSKRSTHQPLKPPSRWENDHTKFVQDLASKGEDAASIAILFEVEFPHIMLGQEADLADVVKQVMAETQ